MSDEILTKNLFMMCDKLDRSALRELPQGFHARTCRKDELDRWKRIHFDTPEDANEYYSFMTDFYNAVYAPQGDLFYEKCLFVCDENDVPVGTCFVWKAYGTVNTIHWFKVVKQYEGLGIGRALLSLVMRDLQASDYPVFLHTQPGSYRAIKLYSDFGFAFLSDPVIGNRENHLEESLPFLQSVMPPAAFQRLRITSAPQFFLDAVKVCGMEQF
jgi:ribosomal protein S18 acetylase RimI-like enzyme